MHKVINYLKEVKVELSKVIWPTRKEALYMTGKVLIFVIIISLFIASIDFIFTKIIQYLSLIIQ